MKTIKVVAAIICNDMERKNKIFATARGYGDLKGGWEFPGGKVEPGETPQQALKREIMEEVGVEVTYYKLLDIKLVNIKWQMDDKRVEDLHHLGILYKTNIKEGKIKDTPDGLDSLGASWYSIQDLKKEDLTPFAIYSLEILGLINK